ncbi:MAG TPA: M4 family metallopeptidase [Vicinamibacterales bacterium]|nr:M4 family metallopeptidase [Vicinamibacterales bacterium]
MARNTLIVAALFAVAVPAAAQNHPGLRRVDAAGIAALRQWDQQVDTMLREGELRLVRASDDTAVRGRRHERVAQYYKGVPVFGADVTRQLAGGQTVSIFGALYAGIALDVTPSITAAQAAAIVQARAGRGPGAARAPQLTVLPLDAGGFALAWRARVMTPGALTAFFVDANSGKILLELSELKTQVTVGRGTGVLGDQKKVSVSRSGGGYIAVDSARPPQINSYDLKGDLDRTLAYLNGEIDFASSDFASDSDNEWTDGATVDAHAYSGYTYDYFFKRHGRSGLDGGNIRMTSIVHPVRRQDLETYPNEVIGLFFINAFYAGNGVMVYGEGLPPGYVLLPFSQTVDYFAAGLDVIAHELSHGVTEYTSNLVYRNESGALDEAFSDIMAVSVEFMFQTPGSGQRQAEYSIGEDVVRPGGFRNLADPGALNDTDHYSRRFTGTEDNGGVHLNATIPGHAFYLAIEGGTNRTSGQSVQGVGASNREQIEKVFYRAFTLMLPAGANFSTARAATIRAARDLYGGGSAADRAVTQAWSAVGVN